LYVLPGAPNLRRYSSTWGRDRSLSRRTRRGVAPPLQRHCHWRRPQQQARGLRPLKSVSPICPADPASHRLQKEHETRSTSTYFRRYCVIQRMVFLVW
jgi:hypothetical protein